MDQNPYQSPDVASAAPSSSSKRARMIEKWIVATIGSLLVMILALFAVLLLPVVVYPEIYRSMIGVVAMYIIAIVLALLAAVLSFRGTLRHYDQKYGKV
jgi:hypothetical protein